jgi:nucleotide-binding universal stress UspA family protein
MVASAENATLASSHPTSPHPILVALDGSGLSARAIPVGARIARNRGVPLLLVRVAPLDPPPDMFGFPVGDYVGERDIAAEYITRAVAKVKSDHPEIQVSGEVLSGAPSRALLEAQEENSPQLTIVTSHGRTGLARMIRGSVTEDLLRGTTRSTLVLWPWSLPDPPSTDEPNLFPLGGTSDVEIGRTVLVPLDGSARTARVVPEAFRHAHDANGEMVLLTVLDLHALRPSRAHELERAVGHALRERADVITAAGVPTRTEVVVSPDVSGSIVAAATRLRADLIAMTTHARGPVGKFVFGSVANRVASRAARPVLFTPPHDSATSFDDLYPDVPTSVLDLAALPHRASS